MFNDRFNFVTKHASDENDNSLYPIMSLMMILVPVLVGNLAFFHYKSITATTPGMSDAQDEPQKNNCLLYTSDAADE